MQLKQYILPLIMTVAIALLLSFNTPPGFNQKGYGFPFSVYTTTLNNSATHSSSVQLNFATLLFDIMLWTIFAVVLAKLGITKHIPAIIISIAVFLCISYLFPIENEYQKLYGFPQAFYRIYKDTSLPEGFVSFFIFYFVLDLIAWMFLAVIVSKVLSALRK